MDGGAWWATYSPRGCKESDTTERLRFHFNLEEFHHSVNPAGTCSLNLRGHLLSGCSRRGSVTVQPQTEPRLALTADGLEVPPALCSFSQQFVRAVGREGGKLLLRAPPGLQKGEERVHFGLDLVHRAAVSSVSFMLIREPQDGMWQEWALRSQAQVEGTLGFLP